MQQDVQRFQTPDGQIHLDVRLQHDAVWLCVRCNRLSISCC